MSGKAYRAEGVTVVYDARRCLHVAECVRGLPAVFAPDVRPWIQPGNAPAAAVADVVRRCPTGALAAAARAATNPFATAPTARPAGVTVRVSASGRRTR